ncbi:MAG TPA: Gfo/Idh/MocA family oxidoreductase [Kofleriaceae bacterium]|nr:Gfo/Idh/MocA family oxidoreductase [Kofleriaceae bacterium]
MRMGLIGAGRMGVMHAENLRALEQVDWLIVADADLALARRMGGDAAVATAAEVFAAGVDGVVIAVPTPAHAEVIEAAAAAGVPVFCEKPVAPDLAQTRAVLARVAAAGIPLMVGFQRRFDAGYAALREAVQSGRLGWLHTVRACSSDTAPPRPEFLPTSGGIFRDCSVHDFDAIRWITGREVASVLATGANRGADFFRAAGDVDTAAALLTLDDGTLAVCTATRYNGAGCDMRIEVCGSTGTMVAGLDDRAPLTPTGSSRWPSGPPYASFLDRFRAAYAAELRVFVEVAAGRMASPCTGEDAVATLLIAEAAERSRREGRAVTVAENAG